MWNCGCMGAPEMLTGLLHLLHAFCTRTQVQWQELTADHLKQYTQINIESNLALAAPSVYIGYRTISPKWTDRFWRNFLFRAYIKSFQNRLIVIHVSQLEPHLTQASEKFIRFLRMHWKSEVFIPPPPPDPFNKIQNGPQSPQGRVVLKHVNI
jgi:hypothetical protein